MTKIVLIMGATASGKSSAALTAALRCGGEIISADSMQIYRRMDIGTAKPTEREQRLVRHHLIDIKEPWESYSAADFTTDCKAAIEDISSRGKLPIICGGTGLYFEGLINPTAYESVKTDPALRESLLARDKRELWDELCKIDPEAAEKTHENNIKRVVRALEIYYTLGITKTELDKRQKKREPEYELISLVTDTSDRASLYARIDARVEEMLSSGLLDEVRGLLDRGDLRTGTTAYQAIGYKELLNYINGQTDYQTAVDTLKQATRNYAKRQITWFSRYDAIPIGNGEEAAKIVES